LAEPHEEKEHQADAQLDILRHSTSHLMAQAVKDLFPGVKVAIGPSIDTGFYYDFDYEPGFTEDDFARIEARMAELVKMDMPIVRKMVKKGRSPRNVPQGGGDLQG